MDATPSHASPSGPGGGGATGDSPDQLRAAIEHASHLLPAQGPITVFIHHNTLHGFEEDRFHEGVQKGARVFGCQPYLAEDRFRDELKRGRIRFDELQAALEEDLGDRSGEEVPCFGTRMDLRMAMLRYPLRSGPTPELVWFVSEVNGLHRVSREASLSVRDRLIAETRRWVFRDLRGVREAGQARKLSTGSVKDDLGALLDRYGESKIESWSDDDWEGFTLQALWRVCCDGVSDLPPFSEPPPPAIRHRDLLLEATGVDTDALVHNLLIPFCAAFLDQGFSSWRLPEQGRDFYRAFIALYRPPGGSPDPWRHGLAGALGRLEDGSIGPLESIRESLGALGVCPEEWDRFLSATLLALRGWGGMIHQIEIRGDKVVHPVSPGSLVGFLAIRLLLDRLALAHVARNSLGIEAQASAFWGLLRGQIDPRWPPSREQRAFLVFQLAQIQGVPPGALHRLDRPGWEALLREIEGFSEVERRRVFHEAYERRFYAQSLDAIAIHARHPAATPGSPRFQAIFCIDEREESLRRHVEEVAPDSMTYGTAGFFSIAMYYRGASDAHFAPLCPGVIVPKHWVVERVVDKLEHARHRRARARRALGLATRRFDTESRSIALGALLTAGFGVLASIPLVARTLFPLVTARTERRLGRFTRLPSATRLQLERGEAAPGPDGEGLGFTLGEMVDIAEKVLREIGLTEGFARIGLVVGHGSNSMNNPHESAHDCGACGGARGGPNGRALAQILNDPRVREALAGRGISIPPTTAFVGAMHNTSSEAVTFFDVDLLPEGHRAEFEAVRAQVEEAGDRDAHERSRRFRSAPLTGSPQSARRHVEGRAEDLAQVRPEWGHATNALCIVGRRATTRGLFLDRRAFLTSYDPTRDDADRAILTRILSAVFPVCAGISLEYYFSYVDNNGYGSGTKLPHNISALVGVMDGAASDLRTGLPWQMVEIHEPVRILFIIETTREAMRAIMDRDPGIGRLCRNEWVKLAVLDPDSRELSTFECGEFRPYRPQAPVLPRAASSIEWYRGWRDHLEFAEIGA